MNDDLSNETEDGWTIGYNSEGNRCPECGAIDCIDECSCDNCLER